ncbi:MAG TPA: hypothetical protein VEJ45_11195 [Candidatus Acidoferrales bacterium]|nr:hypothetical protein [Candidatus Acidoferrales bacterium]
MPSQASLRPAVWRVLCERWPQILATCALILTPCFWHREIVSADLGSHLYNAWLVELIRRGQAPGLWIAPLRTNVLFDLLLSRVGSVLGWGASEKIVVSIAVLIFFWGIFALVSAAARRPPWFLVPLIALVTYGWTFHLGLFNYYLSLGLSFFSLAILWRATGWERWIALAIAPLVLVAHPLGFFWLLGAGAYIWIHENTGQRVHVLLFALAVAAIGALHFFLFRHYPVDAAAKPFYAFNGADQLVLFGERYRIVARAVLIFAVVSLAIDLIARRREHKPTSHYSLPLQLYLLTEVAIVFLPDAVAFPPPTAAVALLTERLTSVSAAMACCLLGAMRPRKWHLVACGAIAAVFFSLLYRDTSIVNKMESQIMALVSELPPNQRVMATIFPPSGSRVLIQHLIDRACIGRCFSYGNYEPGAALFRVRALPGNPYVLSDYGLAVKTEKGDYLVQPRDLPVYQIYQCTADETDLCIRSLEAGEENDRLGKHPNR